MNEAQYKRKIRNIITNNGGKAVPLITGEMGSRGEPDIIGVATGLPFVIEAKVGKNEPTPIQLERLEEWLNAGSIPIIARYPDHHPESVYAFLEMLYEDGEDYRSRYTVEAWAEYFWNFALGWGEDE